MKGERAERKGCKRRRRAHAYIYSLYSQSRAEFLRGPDSRREGGKETEERAALEPNSKEQGGWGWREGGGNQSRGDEGEVESGLHAAAEDEIIHGRPQY